MVRTPLNSGRPGVTLTEVLVALFVMAIGMISLLTLFPLGAMQVGQALRDDRCTQLARQADGYLRDHWRMNVVAATKNGYDVAEPYFWAMDDPNLITKQAGSSNTSLMTYVGSPTFALYAPAPVLPTGEPIPFGPPAALVSRLNLANDTVAVSPPSPGPRQVYANYQPITTDPSYPVMIDLTATVNRVSSNPGRYWVGYNSGNQVQLPRRTTNAIQGLNAPAANVPLAFEQSTLIDDMTFAANGAPSLGVLGRQGRYSWAAVIQRPRNDNRLEVDLSVLVFDGRSQLPQTGDEYVAAPNALAATGTRTISVTLPNRTSDTSPVLLRRGGWIIDGTIDPPPLTPTSRRHFIAYRVSGYTEGTPGPTTTPYEIDIESPLKKDLTATSQLYLFSGLIEVFTRPPLRADTNY